MANIGDKNLCVNPSAETGLHGWTLANAALSLGTVEAFAGIQAFRASASADVIVTLQTPLANADARSIKIEAGKTYSVSARIKSPIATSSHYITILYRNASDANTGNTNGATINGVVGEWVTVQHTLVAPPDSTILSVLLRNNGLVSQTWDIDGIMVHEGSTPLDYGDGDQPGWQWTGTPHDSISAYVGIPNASGRGPVWVTGQLQHAKADLSGAVVRL